MPDDTQERLAEIGSADVVIGMPSYNNGQTIGAVLEAAREGLGKHFPQARSALVISDAGSTDGTLDLVTAAEWEGPRLLARHEVPPAERVEIPAQGIPGRAAAQRTILEAAQQLRATACLLMAPDCRSIAPDWVDRLLRPILEGGYDYVVPLYHRHRYDGTLTNSLISPLMRAVYGKRIRPPLTGQNSLSPRLIARLVPPEVWRAESARHGIDLRMTVTAVTDGLRVCECWLGSWVVESSVPTPDLTTTLAQTVGPAFALLEETAEAWLATRGSEAVPSIGVPLPPGVEPVEIDVQRMVRAFKLGLKDLLPLWERVLAPENLTEVVALGPLPEDAFRFPHDLWARVVYDFALGYHLRVLYRGHLLGALVPLYLGRVATFIRETRGGGAREMEEWLERSCRAFEQQKRYLAEQWL
jgi:glucosylglycerate synthase